MSEIAFKAILFYAVGAVVIGVVFASHETVTASWRGKPLRYPRLFGGIAAGVIWPFVFVKMIWRR